MGGKIYNRSRPSLLRRKQHSTRLSEVREKKAGRYEIEDDYPSLPSASNEPRKTPLMICTKHAD
jgi:hypothetical protein